MSTTDLSAEEFLMGGGVKSAEFPDRAYGTTWTGTICQQPTLQQQTDLKTGELKFWKSDGKPMMQLVVVIQTDVRDPNVEDDDGKRAFYIKAKLKAAVQAAVRAGGAKNLAVGGTLSITYTGDGVQEQKGYNPPKLYAAVYQPPSAAQANAFLNGQQPAQAQAAPQYAPQPAQGFVPQNQGPAPQWAAPAAPAAPAHPVQTGPNEADIWTPPPGMPENQAAALAALSPEQRKALGF
jgi:hypothetical protein